MASRCLNRSLFTAVFRQISVERGRVSVIQLPLCNHVRFTTFFSFRGGRIQMKKALQMAGICTTAAVSVVLAWNHLSKTRVCYAATRSDGDQQFTYRTKREKRFNDFASCQYNGELLMTPRDFLESMTMSDPRGRIGRKNLTKEEVHLMLQSTPAIKNSSKRLFRNIYESGLITFTEYLFLLTILTRSKRGVEIAFDMLDVDGNKQMDKHEFLALEEMVNMKSSSNSMKAVDDTTSNGLNTTLLIHFFGPDGKNKLSFEHFFTFRDNLQYEALELEFLEFSRGMPKISEEDFARILLRNTNLHPDDRHQFLARLTEKHADRKGITMEQFIEFNNFLNNLDDFTIAIHMYTVAQQPVSKEEFQRAAKSVTGKSLDQHTLYTVFVLFDVDGDGMLSYQEFLDVMKDRVKRGFRAHGKDTTGWEGFKLCVKREMTS